MNSWWRAAPLLLCLVTGLAPLALGSNRPLPWAWNALLAGSACFLVAAGLFLRRETQPPPRLDLIIPSLLLWCAALAWALVQAVPLDHMDLVHLAWRSLAEALGERVSARISVNPHETLLSASRLLTYGAIFLCTFVVAREPRNASLMLRGFVGFATVYAVYGLIRHGSASPKIIWFDALPQASLSSSFVNRNSAATYFGIAACASWCLLLGRGHRRFTLWFGFELVIFVLLLAAALLTRSRAGVVATLLALCAGLVLSALRQSRQIGNLMLGLAAATMFAVLAVSGTGVAERLMAIDIGTEARAAVLHDSLAALHDHALYGTGLGTFQDIYPLYRGNADAAGLVWDKAHDDYVEILLGLGIPAGGAAIIAIAMLALACLRGVFRRRHNGHFPLTGFMASVLVGLHAFFDFSLQVQAVALSLALLLGLGVAQSVSDRS